MLNQRHRTDPFSNALSQEGITGQLAHLARSVFQQESSSGTNTATSNHGARGGMQIMPGTFKEVADKGWDINNPEHNYRAGIRYLKKMYDYADGDPRLAAIGYYGGRGGINKARQGVAVRDPKNPNAPDTFQYGDQVASRLPGELPIPAPQGVPQNYPSTPPSTFAPRPVPPQLADAPVPPQITERGPMAPMQQAMASKGKPAPSAAAMNYGNPLAQAGQKAQAFTQQLMAQLANQQSGMGHVPNLGAMSGWGVV